jgi:tRNA(fMet)-specific endonuclease VapC
MPRFRLMTQLQRLQARCGRILPPAGMPIGAHDLQIAAIAMAHDLILVTHNVREFNRVVGLRIEDWQRDDNNPGI